MQEVLMRAGCFIVIIILGYLLRKINFLDETAFPVISKMVLKITLPASIIVSFNGKEIDASLLAIVFIAVFICCFYMVLGFL